VYGLITTDEGLMKNWWRWPMFVTFGDCEKKVSSRPFVYVIERTELPHESAETEFTKTG
jgi:hypothetical protein